MLYNSNQQLYNSNQLLCNSNQLLYNSNQQPYNSNQQPVTIQRQPANSNYATTTCNYTTATSNFTTVTWTSYYITATCNFTTSTSYFTTATSNQYFTTTNLQTATLQQQPATNNFTLYLTWKSKKKFHFTSFMIIFCSLKSPWMIPLSLDKHYNLTKLNSSNILKLVRSWRLNLIIFKKICIFWRFSMSILILYRCIFYFKSWIEVLN